MREDRKRNSNPMCHNQGQKKVLFVNVTHTDYPRHKQLANAFRDKGFAVEVIQRPEGVGYFARCVKLLASAFQHKKYSTVVLAEFAISYAWVSWIIAKLSRSAHIVDGFIGMHETHVEDTQKVRPGSFKGIAYRWLDWLAFVSADYYLIDTHARRKALLDSYGYLSRSKSVIVLPVGAPDWASPQAMPMSDEMQILYYGNYIPLHGVSQFIEALALLDPRTPWHATFIGPKKKSTEHERLAEKLGLAEKIDFMDSVRENELIGYIREHHVVVGIFGDSNKARSVIANKVWQGLAAGRVVLTRNTQGISEIASTFPGSLLLTDSDTPSDIAVVLDQISTLDFHAMPLEESKRLVDAYTKHHYDEFLSIFDGAA
ncbi:glycosyltransferase [Kocuria rosea]|nr:glycosyltransferase [Kocuria rosea]THE19463.1 glycosyltransferase [Kocuria rosea]